MDSLNGTLIFVRTVEAKSFTGAAGRLGMSPSGVSKSLSRLEAKLGVRLLDRTTRSLKLTHEGAIFYERCAQIVGDLEAAEEAVSRFQKAPIGRLRVQIPAGFGSVLIPHLVRFAETYDRVVLDVRLSNLFTDLEPGGFDVLVLSGNLSNPSLITRKLCEIRYIAVASPRYLEKHGRPETPDDLAKHRCLGYYLSRSDRYREWPLGRDGERHPMSGGLNMNNEGALLKAALADGGIAFVPTYLAVEHVEAGRLSVVMTDYVFPGQPISICYLDRRQLSARIRAFVDFLVKEVPHSPPLRDIPQIAP